MKEKNMGCIGNCRLCTSLGECPADKIYCEDCKDELEQCECIEIEVEAVERGQRATKIITVCSKCYEAYYQAEADLIL